MLKVSKEFQDQFLSRQNSIAFKNLEYDYENDEFNWNYIRQRTISEWKLLNFDSSEIIDRKNGFDIKLKLNSEPNYPWYDKLYSTPKILEYLKLVTSRRNSIKQIFMK